MVGKGGVEKAKEKAKTKKKKRKGKKRGAGKLLGVPPPPRLVGTSYIIVKNADSIIRTKHLKT